MDKVWIEYENATGFYDAPGGVYCFIRIFPIIPRKPMVRSRTAMRNKMPYPGHPCIHLL